MGDPYAVLARFFEDRLDLIGIHRFDQMAVESGFACRVLSVSAPHPVRAMNIVWVSP